jgi:hypothetical protein
MSTDMLIECPSCNGKARIASTHKITPTVKHLYCQCKDAVFCGITFVESLSFSHVTNTRIAKEMQPAVEKDQMELFD